MGTAKIATIAVVLSATAALTGAAYWASTRARPASALRDAGSDASAVLPPEPEPEPETPPAPPAEPERPIAECNGAPPIPGPSSDLAERHLADATLAKREADKPRAHPSTTMVVMQRSLVVAFSKVATVREANVAICTSGAQLVTTMPSLGIVGMQTKKAGGDFSDLEDVRARLLANQCVEVVSLDGVSSPGGSGGGAPTGKLSRPTAKACAWAALRLMKSYDVAAPLSCHTGVRTMVNGKELQIAQVRSDLESSIVAIVAPDGGVFPVRATGKHASVALTGNDHWTQRTRMGRYAVQRYLFEADRSVPEPRNVWDTIAEDHRAQLAAIGSASGPCLASHYEAHPASRGTVVNLAWKVHPSGKVSDVKTITTVDMDGTFAGSPAQACLIGTVKAQRFPPHDTDDIFEHKQVYSIERAY